MQETKHFDLADLNEILDFIDQMQIKNVKIGGFDKEEVYYRMLELAQKCIEVAEVKIEAKLDNDQQGQALFGQEQQNFAYGADAQQSGDLANELNRVQSLYAAAQNEINDLQAQLRQKQEQTGYIGGGAYGMDTEASAASQQEIQDLRMELQRKQDQIDSLMRGAEQMSSGELAETKAALRAAQDEVRDLRATLKQKQDQINSLYAQNAEKTFDPKNDANYQAAQREIRELKAALKQKQEQVGAYERQEKYLREARDILKEAKTERNRLLHEAEMVAEQELLLAQAQARKKVAALSGDVESLERRKRDLESQIKQAEQGMAEVSHNSQEMAKTLSKVYTRFTESSQAMATTAPNVSGEKISRMQQRHDQRVVK